MSETTYDVVLLVEQPLSAEDAAQVRSLHEDVEDPVRYHVLLPVEDAAARVESAMGSLAASEVLASPALVMDEREHRGGPARAARAGPHATVDGCVDRARAAGRRRRSARWSAPTRSRRWPPRWPRSTAAEAIILTRQHVVAEFFHVDWTSRARRKLGVPVLHLLEHENFDEQAGGGEGVTGF